MDRLGTDLFGICMSVQDTLHKDFELFDNVCWKHLTFEVGAMPKIYAFRQERGLVEQEALELVYILELCLGIYNILYISLDIVSAQHSVDRVIEHP